MLLSTMKLLLAIVMSIIFGPLKTVPRSSKSCDFQGSHVSSFDFSTLCTSLLHDLIKGKSRKYQGVFEVKSVVSDQLVFQQRVKSLPLYFT